MIKKRHYNLSTGIIAAGFCLLFSCNLDPVDLDCPVIVSMSATRGAAGEEIILNCQNLTFSKSSAYELRIDDQLIDIGSIDQAAQTVRFEIPKGMRSGAVKLALKGFSCGSETVGTAPILMYKPMVTGFNIIAGQPSLSGSNLLNSPVGLAIDAATGNVFVADQFNRSIKEIRLDPRQLNVYVGNPNDIGCVNNTSDGRNARFIEPVGLACSQNSGFLVVSDRGCLTVRKVDLATNRGVALLAGVAEAGGGAAAGDNVDGVKAQFRSPEGVAVTNEGLVFIADADDSRIRMIDTRISANTTSTLAGSDNPDCRSVDGKKTTAKFCRPYGLAFDETKRLLYVTEFSGRTIRVITLDGEVSTLNPANGASLLNAPAGICIDQDGNLYVADFGAKKILRYDLAGNELYELTLPFPLGGVNGLNGPKGIAFDPVRNRLYIADTQNHIVLQVQLE